MADLSKLHPGDTLLLLIDLQDKLMPAIYEAAAVIDATRKLIESARVLEVPLVATEQYPAGLGPTCAEVARCLAGEAPIAKMKFTGCVEPVVQRLRDAGRPHVLVAGVEAHVCVQQTVLDLLRLGYRPYVCADAVGSRRPLDRDVALERMRRAGAVVTTAESAVFELLGEAGTDAFKRVLKVVK
jgi:nicotinamidase-related amidase